MKRNILKLFWSTLLILLYTSSILNPSELIKPENYKEKLIITVKGNKFDYYQLNKNIYSKIDLKGPGQLKIITRKMLVSKSESSDYGISLKLNGNKYKDFSFKGVKAVKNEKYAVESIGFPSERNNILLDLNRGQNIVEIKSASEVIVRILFKSSKNKKEKWIAFSPVSNNQPVELITREQISKYYRFSAKDPLQIEVIGPTRLRIFTRFENNYKHKGSVNYRLRVEEDNQLLNTFLLSSRRSMVTYYRKNTLLMPGIAKEIFIEVGSGKHIYKVYPIDEDKKTILGKILLPKTDI